jgi:multiple sugar transport system ATP-binding protein
VFQSYALYPHLKIYENVAFSLILRRIPRKERAQRVEAGAILLQIQELLGQRPRQLSGGQKQRVAMGRAIVREPTVFLLDEPLSSLDAKLRIQMRAELVKIRQQLQTTTLYVTHDQVEAMTMGDRVAVMDHGVLQQVGDPRELYRNPVNRFVAGFIGSPSMNFLDGHLKSENGRVRVDLADGNTLEIDRALQEAHPGLADQVDKPIVVGIRPECFRPRLAKESEQDQSLRRRVGFVERLGSQNYAHLDRVSAEADRVVEKFTILARLTPELRPDAGSEIDVPFDATKLSFFDAETGETI